jgi:hypothetical protein
VRRILAVPLLAAVVVAVSPNPSFACSCARGEPKEDAAQADVVFAGELSQLRKGPHGRGQIAIFAVDRAYKGRVPTHISLRTGSATCRYPFEEARDYTVFAFRSQDDTLHTHICTPTTSGQIDPARFGLAMSALATDVGGRTDIGIGLAEVVTAVGLAALALVALAATRRRFRA